ncbi:hypothetical protein N7493_007363 [Penicillium malachiteum]|uniref:Amidase domain-containing protein n=1 Tax=Penicillium malachiteum TaxID=1324776 RepID=A0AAD6MUS7_9EURO|nr:hypothetical protein N7493_007363 [Penicillium malachiteum]
MRLINASIKDLAESLQRGEVTSVSLVEVGELNKPCRMAYIARIQQVNGIVKAVSEINPDALELAEKCDEERLSGRSKGILHGIPFLAKDMFLTTDRMQTTAGCKALQGAEPSFEATVIAKLRNQGAILLGKSALTQWANYRSPRTAPNGWSSANGQCTAPFADYQDPSGSSSGSAVAVSLGLCAFGLGTEASSITNPAQKAAVVGLRPTTGLVSRHGVYSVSEYQDSVGVHGRTVDDCAIALSSIAGGPPDNLIYSSVDPEDHFTMVDPLDGQDAKRPEEGTDFSSNLESCSMDGIRIAVPSILLDTDRARLDATKRAIDVMTGLGAIIIEDAEFLQWETDEERASDEWKRAFWVQLRDSMIIHLIVCGEMLTFAHSFLLDMGKFLGSFNSTEIEMKTLSDVINYTISTPEERAEEYGIEEWVAAEHTGQSYDRDSQEYETSLRRRLEMGDQAKELLDRYHCDIYLASSSKWQPGMTGGYPSISIPIGAFPQDTPIKSRPRTGLVQKGPGIPFSIVMVARRWDDQKLIEVAKVFEQAMNVRQNLHLKIEPTAEVKL